MNSLLRFGEKFAALASCILIALPLRLSAQTSAPAIFVKMSTSQVASGATPTAATTTSIAAPGAGWSYSAAAPIAGNSWNQVLRPNPSIGSNNTSTVGQYVCNSANNLALADAMGATTSVRLTVSLDIQDLENNTTRTEPNSSAGSTTATGPAALMGTAWRIYRGGNGSLHRLTGLPANANYFLYAYGTTTTNDQGCKFTLDAANVPAGSPSFLEIRGGNAGNLYAYDGANYSLTSPAIAGVAAAAGVYNSWGRIHAVVDATGTLSFRTAKNSTNGQYYQGYQLMPYPLAAFTAQPMPTTSATVGSSVTITAAASGEGTLTYQWTKGGAPLSDGASGTGSNYSGVTSLALTLSDVTSADAGDYAVVVTNPGGSVTSTVSTLSVSTGAIAPSIVANPVSVTGAVNGTATFSVAANGTAPLGFQWQKSLNNVAFTDIPSASSSTLVVSPLTAADAGYYRVVVTNSVGTVTSSFASLIVAPVINTPPPSVIVAPGVAHTISVEADVGSGSPEPVTYVWKRGGVVVANGATISGATTANLLVNGFTVAQSGYYTVTVSNSAGTVTTAPVYVGLASTQTVTFAPGNNATGIAIDQQLRLIFPLAPKLGKSGAIRVHDAIDDTVVATVDISTFLTYAPGNSSAIIPNAAIRSAQGSSAGTSVTTTNYYYTPIAIYGKEAWVTLPAKLAYAKTYYVTMDAAVLLDSTNAAFPVVSGQTAWRFTTKAAGPAAATSGGGPETITVGLDGSGDFATLQAAFDWMPLNNTIERTIKILPGVYRENATLGYGRNKVKILGKGAKRTDVQIVYPYAYFAPPSSVSTAGTLRIEGDDVTIRNLTLDNLICYDYSPTGRPENVNLALNGATNTLHTTGKRLVFDDVLIRGGQDTYWGNKGIAYFYNCEIWGTVDFIYGGALAVFEQCDIVEIRSSGGPICAPSTAYGQPYGEVFLQCRFPRALVANGYPYDVGVGTTTFCRPWRQDGHVAIINSQLGSQFSTKAWGEWDGRENTARAIEYGNTLIAGGAAPTPAQRRASGAYWLNTVDPDYTNAAMSPTDPLLAPPAGTANRMVLTIDPTDYTVAAIFGHAYFAADLNGWMPVVGNNVAPAITTPPASQRVAVGQEVTFTVEATGSPTLTYQWLKGTAQIPAATGASYTITSVQLTDQAAYSCMVTNGTGSVTSAAATLTVLTPVAFWADAYGLDGTAAGFTQGDADGDGVLNLVEYLLGGDPTAADAGILPAATLVEAVDGKYLVLEYKRAVAASALPVVVETSPDLSAWTARTDGVNAEIEVIPSIGLCLNVDVNSATANNYTGLAVAPGAGTVWNGVTSTATSLTDLKDSAGVTTPVDLAITSSGSFFAWSNAAAASGTPNPVLLMQDYFFGNTYTVNLSSLPTGSYHLYVYAHGDADAQISTVTLATANGGGVKNTLSSGDNLFRDAFAAGAEGTAYVRFAPMVDTAGTLQFSSASYLNGFQLVQLTDPDHEVVRVTIPYAGERLFARLRVTE